MNAKALDLDLDQASNNGSFKVVLRGGQADRMDHLHQQMGLADKKVQDGLAGFIDLVSSMIIREGLKAEARTYIDQLRLEHALGETDLTYDPESKELTVVPTDGQRQPDPAS